MVVMITAGATVACSAGPATSGTTDPGTTGPQSTAGPREAAGPRAAAARLPSAHVHALARDPGSGNVVVATHDGLFVFEGTTPQRVGPVIDLMGFTVAGPGHYYASGHPGPAADLPQPVGLIESRDGGNTWTLLSRGGRSDFHALTTAGETVVGFDGSVRATADGRTWTEGDLDTAPRTLAGSRSGSTVLATTSKGLMRSTDGGSTWRRVGRAPRLLLAGFGEEESVAGLTPDGQVHTSDDAGLTWRATQLVAPDAEALHVSGQGEDLEILVSSGQMVLTSTGGRPFEPLR